MTLKTDCTLSTHNAIIEKEAIKPVAIKAMKKAKIEQQLPSIIEVPDATKAAKAATKKVATKTVKKSAAKKIAEVEKTAKKPTAKKTVPVKHSHMNITFQLRFHTNYGQSLYLCGNHALLGNNDVAAAIPMEYFNDELWYVSIEWPSTEMTDDNIEYYYVLKNEDGAMTFDHGNDKKINPAQLKQSQVKLIDSWNHAGYLENSFYTRPFKNVLLKSNATIHPTQPKNTTHQFKVKAPLLGEGQVLCLLGSAKEFGAWNTDKPVLLAKETNSDWYVAKLNLEKAIFPIAYKYGVYDIINKKFIQYESGNNRVVYDVPEKDKLTIITDGFAILPNNTWKGAGIAIPVFSLRSESSFGVGEFTDLNLLTDWAKQVGLKLIQILPINDTTATHTWNDSYPYAAISAFALHPIFINLSKVVNTKNASLLEGLKAKQQSLNQLDAVDYETVMSIKMEILAKIFTLQKVETFASTDYQNFFAQNQHWLKPYAVFCYLRDQYNTADFNQWPAFRHFKQADVESLCAEDAASFDDIALQYFIQYHLHLQLKAATDYAHDNGIVVKGDIPIGIYRYSVDAWQQPALYHMEMQAGAPPDDFAIKGQNWGFPTYNWQKMQEDGFDWWQKRFAQMSYYFDAFRIDHILGFFRIWSIPMDAVEGIMGRFVPAIPVHINEFGEKGIWFDYQRYTRPYINDGILWQLFGYDNEKVKAEFLDYNGQGGYQLKQAFDTQRKVENHFATLEQNQWNDKLKQGLFDLISNVILFEVEGSQGQQYHFRFGIESTTSFQGLEQGTKDRLKELYVNYFFRRQDDFWMKEAMKKLPALRRTTDMLICGEDLGLVPDCVPDVMKQLGMLSLEIQRMPKDPKRTFFHPNDAPYMSVVTPSTHDMSTIRGWWEEDKDRIQQFFNNEMGQFGEAPFFCEAWINKAIVLQHLYSPAMWSIFQLQDILGIDDELRRENPNDERINVPANPKHYWRYRMHMTLEQLMNETVFNKELQTSIASSGR